MSKLRNLCTLIIGFSIAGPALATNLEQMTYTHVFTGKFEHDNQYDERVHVDENVTGLFDFSADYGFVNSQTTFTHQTWFADAAFIRSWNTRTRHNNTQYIYEEPEYVYTERDATMFHMSEGGGPAQPK